MVVTRLGLIAALATVALPRSLTAQHAPLARGQEVRVVSLTDGTIRQGRLMLVLADSVVLQHGDRTEYAAVGRLGRLEVPRPVGSHLVAGAVFGAAAGALVGVVAWSGRGMFSCASGCEPLSGQVIGQKGRILLGGLVGLGVGALIGSHYHTLLWDPVAPEELDGLRLGVVVQPDGRLGLGAALTF